ncbi:hypothetical protein [Bailinhaonella thermotolerans]|uniref:Ribosomal protein L7/L12 C-terminal domain-containing protein n=1 Tax=Bailinhaonella thermotolerans TaxID=1070861 RepID=A0A3A4A7T5_9ACTN|nr:hypothetical protein [Bailinhaonella thermotolerans]RJL23047.1 hypothetical protein D5H75_34310 [Bailinhaonella thermotolerans]
MDALPTILVLAAAALAAIFWMLRRAGRSRLTVPAPATPADPEPPGETPIAEGSPDEFVVTPGSTIEVSEELVERIQELLAQGMPLEAIAMVEEATGFSPREAKAIVDAVRDATEGSDLADAARTLKAEGRVGDAIELVRDRTGMTLTEAAAFVQGLRP